MKAFISNRLRPESSRPKSHFPKVVATSYTSHPVDIPDSFLAPLSDPSVIEVSQIDFLNSLLRGYAGRHAFVLDNVFSDEECKQLIYMAEQSAGAHRGGDDEPENNGWTTAMVNAGPGHEFHAPDYRNSDRIIWDNKDMTQRIWRRVLQGEGMKEHLLRLNGEKYETVIGKYSFGKGQRWVATDYGINERMRFLKYGAGQFFRRHCDGTYGTPDGKQLSMYTIHIYLNDSAQALEIPEPEEGDNDPRLVDSEDKPADLLRGGATTFHGRDDTRLDVDPKAGRVLIFQQRDLLHSGDDVRAGIKYTLRSDIMYELESGESNGGAIPEWR